MARALKLAGLVILGSFVLSACGEGPIDPSRTPVVPSRSHEVARVVAAALAHPEASAELRNALRSSKFVQHKVDLGQFLESERGERVRGKFAAVLGLKSMDEIRSYLGAEALDLWMPSRAQRLHWQGTPDVVVAAQVHGDAPPRSGFASSGALISFDELRAPTARASDAPALVFIAPSEGLALRMDPQPDIEGMVVEERGDGQFGGIVKHYLNNGDSTIVQVADLLKVGISKSGMASVMSNTPGYTYLNRFYVIAGEDFNSDTDPLELRWTAELRRRTNGSVVRSTLTSLNVANYVNTQYENLALIDAVQNATGYVFLKLREDDGWWATDNYGDFTVDGEGANYVNAGLAYTPHFGGGGYRCGTYPVFGTLTCPFNQTIYSWREVSFNLRWTHPQAPPVVAEVTGPTVVTPGYEYTWSIANLAGSAMPYTYQWYVDGAPAGTGATLTATLTNPASLSTIMVDVIDQGVYWVQPSLIVNVNSGSCEPNDPNCNESLRAPTTSRRPSKQPQQSGAPKQ